MPVRRSFFDNMASEELQVGGDGKLSIGCPVKILHGVGDDTVPFETR